MVKSIYKNKFQITNPEYIRTTNKGSDIKKIMSRYQSIKGISDKTLQKIYSNEANNIKQVPDWYEDCFLREMKWVSWSDSIKRIHNPIEIDDINKNSKFYERLAYDEIFCNLLVFNEIKKRIQLIKKNPKKICEKEINLIFKMLPFKLTDDQNLCLNEIIQDMKSEKKMMRVLQGDVGSGKTVIALIAMFLSVKSNFQSAIMVPTEILAIQHFNLFKKFLNNSNIKIELLTGKTKLKNQEIIRSQLKKGEINILVGTHSLFQDKIEFKNLGLIVIDEQHKFGVKQRISLALKGSNNTDVLLMTATPIPRTLVLTNYGDMDISTIKNKPFSNNNIDTLIKPIDKLDEVIDFVNKKINFGDQIYWVCPLIEESEKSKLMAVIKRHNFLKKKINKEIGLIHGSLKKNEKDLIMKNFIQKKLKCIISTTVIEVGIDNPNANTIIVENAERFGLSQLHQLRGRVGRSGSKAHCLLIYSSSISETGKKRLKIMKKSNDGFYISEEDLRLRGFGDIVGYKQSGEKDFIIADPIYHSHLFELAKNNLEKINKIQNKNFETLFKIFKKEKVLNIIDTG